MTPLHPRVAATALLLLTASTGTVDAVSFLGLDHVFTGNMTGNVLFLGFALVGVPGIPFLNNLVALIGFIVGSIVSGRIVGRGHPVGTVPRGSVGVLLGGGAIILVLTTTWLALGDLPEPVVFVVTFLLAVVMGGQVSAVKPIGNSDITTIVVTNTIANLARDSRLGGGHGQRWHERVLAVICMGAGAAIGAASVLWFSGAVGLIVSTVIYAAAAILLILARRPR